MNIEEVLALYDREQRREIEYPDLERHVLPRLVRFVHPAPGRMSFVLHSELDETTAGSEIDGQIDWFSRRGQSFEWKVYDYDRPADLVKRLVERGFEAEEPEAIMVLDLAAAPASLLAEPKADIRRLSDTAQLADVVHVLEPVWGENFDWVYDDMGRFMEAPNYLSVFVAYVEDEPASVGWTYYSSSHFAGLWGGSTLEAHRGRGLYTAVLAARVQEARDREVPYLTIDTGPMSRPIVAGYGFKTLTYATACEYKPVQIEAIAPHQTA